MSKKRKNGEKIEAKSDQVRINEPGNNRVMKAFLFAKLYDPNSSFSDKDFARTQLKGFGVQF
jgi:hypothetical protein